MNHEVIDREIKEVPADAVFQVIRLWEDSRLKIPRRATEGSAGFDLQAACETPITIYPGEHRKIETGLKIWIRDQNVVGIITPKSGAGLRGFGIKNTVGVIDSDYQGELVVTLWNTNEETPIEILPFMQIAQIIFIPFIAATLTEVRVFRDETKRGTGGFGSTSLSSSETAEGVLPCQQ
jgi:dUTP pyrophosphatase